MRVIAALGLISLLCPGGARADLGDPSAWRVDFPASHAPDGAVGSIAQHDGSLFVSGSFEFVDNRSTPGIARFDGSSWHPEIGPGHPITSLTSTAHGLIAFCAGFGLFVKDGSSWESLASPGIGSIRVVMALDGSLVISSDSSIQSWDGSQWDEIADFGSRALGAYQGNLVAAGGFGAPGFAAIYDLDLQDWQSLGSQLDRRLPSYEGSCYFDPPFVYTSAIPRCFAEWNGELIMGGSFHRIDGDDSFVDIARWDGSTWTAFDFWADGYCEGLSGGERWWDSNVTKLMEWNGHLWGFRSAWGQNHVQALLRLDSLANEPVLIAETVNDLGALGSELYVSGQSLSVSTYGLGRVAGDGVVPTYATPSSQSGDYRVCYSVDGVLQVVDAASGRRLRWAESSQSFVYAGEIYATSCESQGCTSFPISPVELIAYDGAIRAVGHGEIVGMWQESFGYGAQHALEIYDGKLVIGGRYLPGGVAALGVTTASFPGPSFQQLGQAPPTTNEELDEGVLALARFGGELIAGGEFLLGGEESCLAVWDGSDWSDFPVPLENSSTGTPIVRELIAFQGELIAIGEFDGPSTTTLPGAARWNGSQWQPLATFDVLPEAVLATPSHLVVGGAFTEIDGEHLAHLAVFDGEQWQGFAGGVDGPVRHLGRHEGGLIVLGGFRNAGSVNSYRIAWHPDASSIGISAVRFTERNLYEPDLGTFDFGWGVSGADFVVTPGQDLDLPTSGTMEGMDAVPLLYAYADGASMASSALLSSSGLRIGTFSAFPRIFTGTQSHGELVFGSVGAQRTQIYLDGALLFDSTVGHSGTLDFELTVLPVDVELRIQNADAEHRHGVRLSYSAVPSIEITRFDAAPAVLIGNQQQVTISYAIDGADQARFYQDGELIRTINGNFTNWFTALVAGEQSHFEVVARTATEEARSEFTVSRQVAAVSQFQITPNPVHVGSTVTVQWLAIGGFSGVLLNGEPVSGGGSQTFVATEDAILTLEVLVDEEVVDGRELSLTTIAPPFEEGPAIVLSAHPSLYEPTAVITPLTVMTAHLLASGLDGGAQTVELQALLPPGMFVIDFVPAAQVSRSGSGNDLLLTIDGCSGEGFVPLGTLSLFATPDFESGQIVLAGSTQSSLNPAGVAYQRCDNGLQTRVAGLPLNLTSSIPIRAFELHARARADGIELSWQVEGTDLLGFRVLRQVQGEWRLLTELGADRSSYLDASADGELRRYRVEAMLAGGYAESREVEAKPLAITRSELLANHPNPFNPVTTLRWAQARPGDATLQIFNLQGALVWSVRVPSLGVGHHEYEWKGVDREGRRVGSGTYLLRLAVPGVVDSRSLMLVK